MFKKILSASFVVFFSIGFFYGCNTYEKSLPHSFYDVISDPKFTKGEILMFRFDICDNDTFSLSINGVSLYTAFAPSESPPTTWTDKHTTSGYPHYYYDFVLYQRSKTRAIIYLINCPNSSFSIPMRNRQVDVTGSYSNTCFHFPVLMGSCKQLIIHHSHKDSITIEDECLHRIRFYE